jgi:hypothetical protein
MREFLAENLLQSSLSLRKILYLHLLRSQLEYLLGTILSAELVLQKKLS